MHTLLLLDYTTISQNNVLLESWLKQMNEDDPAWTNVTP
jgi:hypothetical protein